MFVHQAIKKYINPTRYRQIIETKSSERLTSDEQRFISEDQKHSSTVPKIFYKKKNILERLLSRVKNAWKFTEEEDEYLEKENFKITNIYFSFDVISFFLC